MVKKIFTEIGFGNKSSFSTEIEEGDKEGGLKFIIRIETN